MPIALQPHQDQDQAMTLQTPDQPAVAGTEDGGPKTGPPLLVPERGFEYAVVPGFFVQDAGDKRVDFEADIVSVVLCARAQEQGRGR